MAAYTMSSLEVLYLLLNEGFEVLLNEHTNPVLDTGDICRVRDS
jgi:hypothetical protein